MADKCPKCGSNNTEITGFHPNRSTDERIASGIGGALLIAGACMAGPIGAIAGGVIGKHFASGFLGIAFDNSGKQIIHCKDCGNKWTKQTT